MPEGDTIFRAAAKLRENILGSTIQSADTRALDFDAEKLHSKQVTRIDARGKHLLIYADDENGTDGWIVHSHMGMKGSWHCYSNGQPWRKPAERAELTLQFDHGHAVCFSPKLLELLTPAQLKVHRWFARLGPDLLSPDFDAGEVLVRFRRRNSSPIGEAIMNQTIVAGIGNVYKSELLFLDGIHPLSRVASFSDEQLLGIMRRARRLLAKNVGPGRRRTRFRGDRYNHWAYGRAGEPCLKCGGEIHLTRQDDLGRTTYFCPTCQPLREERERSHGAVGQVVDPSLDDGS